MRIEHYISESEVQAATQLAANGEQRLRSVSALDSTLFHFPISCGDDFASAIIEVSPVSQNTSRNPSYSVAAEYTTCYDVATAAGQTDEIHRVIQLTYDTYVQAIRWTFGDDCLEGRFSHSHAECLAQKALHLSRLNRKLDTEPRAEHHAASLLGASPLPASTEAPSSLPSLAESDINEHRSSEQDGTTFLDETDIDASESRVRDGEYIEDDQKLANGLIAKALRGLKRMRKYGNQRFCSSSIQALVCKRDKKLCDKEIDELLSKLEKEHLENAQTAKLELRVRAWMSWFFGASLRVALDTRRRRKLHRRASAASILYCTLNQLLRTEGIQAMSLIFAYAYTNHCLSGAASTSQKRQTQISHLVATGLRGKLSPPSGDLLLPIPVVWVAAVTNCSYLEACYMLCVPNLAALQLEPQWVRIDEKRYHLVHEIRYSELSNRWEGFCHWSKSRKQEEFSQVVAEWCRQRRSQIDQADAFRPSLINASTTASASRFSGSDIVPLLDPTLQAVSDNHHSKKRTYQANKNAEHGYIESVSRIVTDPQKRQRQAEDGTTDCGSIGIQQLGAGVGAGVGSRATTTADVARVSSQTNTMFEETASMTAHQMATANDLATDWTSAWESNEPFQPIFLPGMYELDSDLWNDGHDLDEVSSDLFQSELPS